MNDLTLWLLIIGCPLAICTLVGIEFYFIIRYSRKSALLNRIKLGNYLINQNFDIIVPATLYGQAIEVAIKDNFIHLINDGKFFAINIDDFISIKHKNGKYVFKIPNSAIANIKVFKIKCNDDRLQEILPITKFGSKAKAHKPTSIKEFLSTSTVRFVIIGILYVAFFVIFAIIGKWLPYFITTLLFMAGVAIYIVFHYYNDEKENSNLNKIEILEKKAKNKVFYSNVVAICLAVALVISLMSAFLSPNSNNDPDGVDGWTQCYKCNKTGKVRNELGFYVTCPRCDGVGYIPD